MLQDCRCVCEADGCDRPLSDAAFALSMTTEAGERRAYECACGAVTITVVRSS